MACLLQFIIAAAKAFDPEKAHAGFELSSYFSRQHKQLRVHHSTVQLCALAPQGIQFQEGCDHLVLVLLISLTFKPISFLGVGSEMFGP